MRTIESRSDLRGGANRIISIVGMLGLIVGLGPLWTRPARAEIQNDAIGFSTNHVLESTDQGEHIDVMTGNMTLAIPLGPRYKLTQDFSYGVTLYYNSKLWEYECDQQQFPPSRTNPCTGSLLETDDYGLGFSLRPGRVYHHDFDKAWVYRLQLEDGSEHFFCDVTAPSYPTVSSNPDYPPNCDNRTSDTAHLTVYTWSYSNPPRGGWRATTTDGRILYFEEINATTHESRLSRIETYAHRPDPNPDIVVDESIPRAWVNYKYTSATNYVLSEIDDSQGRTIAFCSDPVGWRIKFPGFGSSGSETYRGPVSGSNVCQSGTTSDYVLHLAYSQQVHDPSWGLYSIDGATQNRSLLQQVDLPNLVAGNESYQFRYDRTNWTRFGWLLQRTLPTGATIDYYYDVYATSLWRPYHTELRTKILTTGGAAYRWTWDRFNVGVQPSLTLTPPSANNPDPGESYSGSNPNLVKVIDPFNNLTVYKFLYSGWTGTTPQCTSKGECPNKWSDGLLESVATYAGPDPDSGHLVREVDYSWASELDSYGQAKMFQYRPNVAQPGPATAHAIGVNTRQIEERTYVPKFGGIGGHTVTAKSSSWFPAGAPGAGGDNSLIVPRLKEEYVDGTLYRSTYTEIDPSAGNWAANKFEHVTDAAGNVVSRVDRKFTNGQLECEIRRNGAYHNDNLYDCYDGHEVPLGDVKTVNVFDDPPDQYTATGATLQTTVAVGDESLQAARTITKRYLTYPETDGTQRNTGYLKSTNYGFLWAAIDRDVDFDTGLIYTTRDPALNATSYTWDGLGRLKTITPTYPEQQTRITYPSIRETHVHQDVSTNNYIESVYFYDDLGRLTETKRRNAGGTWDIQRTDYDVAGRVTRKSEWAPDGTADAALHWTVNDYTIYSDLDTGKHADPLGRIHGVTTPDDLTPQTPTTEYTYDGDTTTVTVRDIRGYVNSADTNVTSTTVYTKDALGRLVSVDAPGTAADATYSYDELDNLTEVQLTDPTNPTHIQVRRFDHDALGRLRAASNPENGTIQYTAYDARGNLLSYTDARRNVFSMTYDAADRLLTRQQVVGGSGQLLVSKAYDQGYAGSGYGHLTQQSSYKVDPSGTMSGSTLVSYVSFAYGVHGISPTCSVTGGGYAGLNGRLNSQTTSIQPWGDGLETDYCQDAAGMPTVVKYPDIPNSGRTTATVLSGYSNGYLQSLKDPARANRSYIKAIIYGPGGVPTELDRPASSDFITYDIRNRPLQIQVQGHAFDDPLILSPGCQPNCPSLAPDSPPDDGGDGGGPGPDPPLAPTYASWSTGYYAYDMAGNVKTIGNEQYHYDESSRLTHATIPGSLGIYSLSYGYDAFGNMAYQSRALGNDPATTVTHSYGVDWLTNRLAQQSTNGGPQTSYTFDENGNMTAEGGRGLVFDAQNRLREVMDPEKGRLGRFDYDASGYRVHAEANGVETFYFRDAGGQVLTEYQRPIMTGAPAPTWNKDYIYAFGKSVEMIKNIKPRVPYKPTASVIPPNTNLQPGLRLSWVQPDVPDLLGYSLKRTWYDSSVSNPHEVINYVDIYVPSTSWDDTTYSVGTDASYTNSYLKYQLTAMDSAGNMSDPGPELIVYPRPGNAIPAAPQNVKLVPGDRRVTVSWDASTSATLAGYYVQRKDSSTGSYVQLNDVCLTAPEFVDLEVVNDHEYWYRVKAMDTAGRMSLPSASTTPTSVIPTDTVPPGKLLNVYADPDILPGRIVVSWAPGGDHDIASYIVYRRTDNAVPGSGDAIGTVTVGSNPPAVFTFTDPPSGTITAGVTYYYSVAAVDNSPHANTSTPSDRVGTSARFADPNAPQLISALWNLDTRGTTSTDGRLPCFYPSCLPTDYRWMGNTDAEDDDLMQAVLHWSVASTVGVTGYDVYRRALGEPRFTLIASLLPTDVTVLSNGTLEYRDSSLSKGDYTYFVAGRNLGGKETAASGPSTATFHRAVDYSTISIRNVIAWDGSPYYSTANKESREVKVEWSRITEPDLVGYNVYRMCSWRDTPECHSGRQRMEHFDCESSWIRINTKPVRPDQRIYRDASTGGLEGCFLYAVRPVGPGGVEGPVEGPIDKIVAASLASGLEPSGVSTYAAETLPDWTTLPSSNPPDCNLSVCTDRLITDVLNSQPAPFSNDPPPINGIHRGTGDPAGAPPPPIAVTRSINYKNEPPGSVSTMFARLTWSMTDPVPSDLLGFHVEVAGSPNGPWQRMTKHPVAWWERSYVTQGVGVPHGNVPGYPGASGHTECLSFRVIAVDEDGNESTPAPATVPGWANPSASNCPVTPNPPTNLRASDGPPGSGPCTTQLDWDPSPGAVEYYVYRIAIDAVYPYFYDTQRIGPPNPLVTTYVEAGDTCTSCSPDNRCGYIIGNADCAMGRLDAYYVTARGSTGGESPRSNLVFWKCALGLDHGYSKVVRPGQPTDAIAVLGLGDPEDVPVCWNRPDAWLELARESDMVPTATDPPAVLSTAPMLRLGQVSNPLWRIVDLHADHLGTVRAITDMYGKTVSMHDYFPFGEEIAPQQLSYNTHQFTGHERDHLSGMDPATGMDYMLARYYEAPLGRLLSVDPGKSAMPADPQTWNRYAYARGNPLRFVDPDGKEIRLSNDLKKRTAQLNFLKNHAGQAGNYLTAVQKKGNWVVGVKDATLYQVAKMGTAAHGLAHMIAAVGSFSLQLGDSPQAREGGGSKFIADGNGGGQLFVNEAAFPKEVGGYNANAGDAFAHEVGHALTQVFPRESFRGGEGRTPYVREVEQEAMSFENAHLQETGRSRDYYTIPGDYVHPGGMDYRSVIP